ncbi:hypothetical protein C7N43_30705 [Sphingobacteriales bacterium UPWRP_1]|nr:hypothetical protein B6N25_01560 [Sphingobacteriales bacterium TSM_CSS]PSJ73132.1 hypothetical protein C7N43_30705 [Sphingobacteriales bacterium UPWRP_1]
MSKHIFSLVLLVFISVSPLFAQWKSNTAIQRTANFNTQIAAVKIVPEWSNYITDPAMPTLKVRERHYLIGNTQKLDLEVQSTKNATGSFTVSTCNENRTLNGWQLVALTPNTPQVLHFETTDACNNGWWWQVSGYKILTDWTDWATETDSPVKACMRYNYDKNGQKFVQLQLVSSQNLTLECAIKVCQTDDIGVNGWRKVQLEANKPAIYNFVLKNSCEDGWWYQYRTVKATGGYGNDMELNGY